MDLMGEESPCPVVLFSGAMFQGCKPKKWQAQKRRFKGFHSKTPSVASISFKKEFVPWISAMKWSHPNSSLDMFFSDQRAISWKLKVGQFGDQIGSRKKELDPILGWTTTGMHFKGRGVWFSKTAFLVIKKWYCWWFRNPANQLICYISPLFTRFYTSQVVVWDFFHQQYQSPHLQVPYLEPQRLPVANLI